MAALATWFTPVLSVLSRSDGKSAVAAAAYRACTRLHDALYKKVHDYTRKGGHVLSKIFGDHNFSIEELWNAAEAADTRKNSRTARELMVPLYFEWTDEQRVKYCDDLIAMLKKSYGVAGVYSIHKPHDGRNYHVHILFTTREVVAGEFLNKTRVLDEGKKNGEISKLRERVAEITNTHSKLNGSDFYVTGGTFAEHIENHIPTVNIPINASKEHRNDLEDDNEKIRKARSQVSKMQEEYETVQKAITALKEVKADMDAAALIDVPVPEKLPPSMVRNSKPRFWEEQPKEVDERIKAEEAERRTNLLNEAYRVRDGYNLVVKSRRDAEATKKEMNALKNKIASIRATEPTIFESVYHKMHDLISKFGLNSVVPIDAIAEREKEIDRLAKIWHEKRKDLDRLANLTNDKENMKLFYAWQMDERYKNAIAESTAQIPKFNPGNNIVAIKQQLDYSDHPYHIEDEPKPY